MDYSTSPTPGKATCGSPPSTMSRPWSAPAFSVSLMPCHNLDAIKTGLLDPQIHQRIDVFPSHRAADQRPPWLVSGLRRDDNRSICYHRLHGQFSTSYSSGSGSSLAPSAHGSFYAKPIRSITLSDLRFSFHLGSGDIGSVYLAEIKSQSTNGEREKTNIENSGVLYAAKVMDKKELASRNNEGRAKTEREILEQLDHPFLPNLHAAIDSSKWLCLLTEFCPGGDLHVLRQRQPFKRFADSSVSSFVFKFFLEFSGVVADLDSREGRNGEKAEGKSFNLLSKVLQNPDKFSPPLHFMHSISLFY